MRRVIAFALLLGALGPALDGEPSRSALVQWLASISDQDWCLIAVGGVLIWVTVVDAIGAGRARGRK